MRSKADPVDNLSGTFSLYTTLYKYQVRIRTVAKNTSWIDRWHGPNCRVNSCCEIISLKDKCCFWHKGHFFASRCIIALIADSNCGIQKDLKGEVSLDLVDLKHFSAQKFFITCIMPFSCNVHYCSSETLVQVLEEGRSARSGQLS